MNYLLDTHTALWFLNGDAKLSLTAKQLIGDELNDCYVSLVSVWEVAIKVSIKKLEFNGGSGGFLKAIKQNFLVLPIEGTHIVASEALPFHHNDPFDRLIIASALVEDMTIITIDENIPLYPIQHIW